MKRSPDHLDLPPSWVGPLDIHPKSERGARPNRSILSFSLSTTLSEWSKTILLQEDGGGEIRTLQCERRTGSEGLRIPRSLWQVPLRSPGYSTIDLVQEYLYVTFHYEHRHDKLDRREHDLRTKIVAEKYRPGRQDRLKGSGTRSIHRVLLI